MAQQSLPEPPQSPDAEAGTRIHAALAERLLDSSTIPVLNEAWEQQMFEDCLEEFDWVMKWWMDEGSSIDDCTKQVEQRLWVQVPKGAGFLPHSGQPDVVVFKGVGRARAALVIDWKTGRNEVPEAATNMQLRDLAVLVWKNHKVHEVQVVPIQPLVIRKAIPCLYTVVDLEHAWDDLCERVRKSHNPESPRIPGSEQCRYCRACGTPKCPESIKPVEVLQALAPIKDRPALPGTIGRWLDACSQAEDVIVAIRKEARRILEAGGTIDGWHLKEGAMRESIFDPEKCWERSQNLGMDVKTFLGCVNIGKGELKKAVGETLGVKGKALDAAMAELLSGIVTAKRCASSLERIE